MISGPVLEDGEHFVFVSGVTASAMTVDPAFLTGPRLLPRLGRKCEIGTDEDLPNGIYLPNPEATVVEMPLAAEFEGALIDGASIQPGSPLDAAGLARPFAGDSASDATTGSPQTRSPMTVTGARRTRHPGGTAVPA